MAGTGTFPGGTEKLHIREAKENAMNTLKRILTILLALVMLTAALCGCAGGK